MEKNQIKSIVVQLGYKCNKEKRCSFCYNKDKISKFEKWNIYDSLKKNNSEDATICFEYSGFNLNFILEGIHSVKYKELTMTTNHWNITDTFCSAMKVSGIKAISLSYDSEKVSDFKEWVKKAKIIKKYDIKVSCNFLIENFPIVIPKEVMDVSDQINLLIKKPTGEITNEQKNMIKVFLLSIKKIVVVDACLAVQLGNKKHCGLRKEFIHIKPDGTIDDCCYKNDCFLYNKMKSLN
jgi:hypothetical protein